MINEYCYRIDWNDFVTGLPCSDHLTLKSAIWEAKHDTLGEIVSITKVTVDENDNYSESENLLEIFKNL